VLAIGVRVGLLELRLGQRLSSLRRIFIGSHSLPLSGRPIGPSIAYLETIRILIVFSVAKGFKLYQMDVWSAFLKSVLEEEVFGSNHRV
jgi:hypothetical protein